MEKVIDLLRRRGFFINESAGCYTLSEYSNPEDAKYLDSLLQEYGVGLVVDGKILIRSPENESNLIQIFDENSGIKSEESQWTNYQWDAFIDDVKVPPGECNKFCVNP